ncbi:MAG: polysaccharide deacetylase family protein [Arcobacter sp.]|nr:polysaccharide deacetylase family protein [Arcobacter sp.]
MSYLHSLLSLSHYPLLIKNNLRRLYDDNFFQLRVLIYHDIPVLEQELFRKQILWLKKKWKFISPDEFCEVISGNRILHGRNLLLTFDDGFKSNRRIAEEILNPLNLKALFFIVSDFVSLKKSDEIKKFISTNIHPGIELNKISDDWKNMNWSDIEFLIENGHKVGAHTKTHARLSRLHNKELLEEEICESADYIQKKIGVPVEHFAYTFGNLESFSKEALEIAKKRFKFIYTGMRGHNTNNTWAIHRDAISPKNTNNLVGAFLEGGADILYKKKIQVYKKWGRN